METTMAIQDVTKSVEQLCNQLTLSNVVVPKIGAYKDVFDFLNEFESVTATLPEEQKKTLLVKAFPPGRLRNWYDEKIKSLISDPKANWKTITDKIAQRYSETEERDRYFKRLNEMKFDPKGQQKLFDFVEDLCYSFSKAFPSEKDDDTKIRYVRSVLPSALKPSLAMIQDYSFPKNLDTFMRGIRQYDSLNPSEQSPTGDKQDQLKSSELVTVLKELVKGVRQEGEATRNVVAALKNTVREPSPQRSRRERYDYSRPRSPSNVPPSQTIQTNRERSVSPYNRRPYPSSPQPGRKIIGQNPSYQQANNNAQGTPNQYYPHARGQSPAKYYKEPAGSTQANTPQGKGSKNQAFDEAFYFNKYGVPPRPCSNCQYMHWERHCFVHLN